MTAERMSFATCKKLEEFRKGIVEATERAARLREERDQYVRALHEDGQLHVTQAAELLEITRQTVHDVVRRPRAAKTTHR